MAKDQRTGKTILLAGGTGFVGQPLAAALLQKGYHVKVLSRSPVHVSRSFAKKVELVEGDSNREGTWMRAVNGCSAVVNLVGEPIFAKKWDAEHKKALYDSRVNSTRNIANAIGEAVHKPDVFVSSSGIGFYGTSLDQEFDERSAAGQDYLASLAKDWEGAAYSVLSRNVRLVTTRIGVVLHPSGGALARMLPTFKLGLGGPLGSGEQWVSWIHRHDLIRMLVVAIEQDSVTGPINGTAPEPVRQKEFAQALAQQLGRPCWLPAPAFALRLMLGEGADIVLSGQKVLPDVIRSAGFKFKYAHINDALDHLLRG